MNMTKQLAKAFETGRTISSAEIKTYFGLKNPQEAVRQLRNSGYCIYTNPNGYRLGTPTKNMVSMMYKLFGQAPFNKA